MKSDVDMAVLSLKGVEELYGELFYDVQNKNTFPDCKTFVDSAPKSAPEEIVATYQQEKNNDGFDLKAFVLKHFEMPSGYKGGFESDLSRSVEDHINVLWGHLKRDPGTQKPGSLIALPHSYIVPGGRFGEIFYWDTYFTMLGLQVAGENELIQNMVDNFSYLIDTIGFVPNGNRTYYLGRSQPPFYSLIVQLLVEEKGEEILKEYLPRLEKEYAFWMDGENELTEKGAHRRLVRLSDGTLINRYWDDMPIPRAESYREDIELIEEIGGGRSSAEISVDLRAACESGWDFTGRWLRDGKNMKTIHTAEIAQIDLNSLLFHLEEMLVKAYTVMGDDSKAAAMEKRANNRQQAIITHFWDEDEGFFFDFDWVEEKAKDFPSIAAAYPLFLNIATTDQASAVAKNIEKDFLVRGGVVTTLERTGQQWDSPNGWAPMQWVTIQGLRNYGFNSVAKEIKKRWVNLNVSVYKETGKLMEKYNVVEAASGGGGEYPNQDGFGWTNGVLLKLLKE